MIAVGDLVLDPESFVVQHAATGAEARITRQQTAILASLIERAGRTVSMEGIARAVWDQRRPQGWTGSIQAQIHAIRKALVAIGLPGVIVTMGQAGWRMEGPPRVVRVYTPEQAAIADAALAASSNLHESTPA